MHDMYSIRDPLQDHYRQSSSRAASPGLPSYRAASPGSISQIYQATELRAASAEQYMQSSSRAASPGLPRAASPAAPLRSTFELPCTNCTIHLKEINELKRDLQSLRCNRQLQREETTARMQTDMKQQADRTRQRTIEKDEMAVAHAKEAHALREQLEQERAMHHQT